MSEPDGPLLHVRAAAWQVLKEVQETGTCGRASLAGLDHSLTVADRSNAWVAVSPAVRGAPTPAMIELRAAAEEVVREMAYLFERDAQDDATLAANDIKDALAYRRLRAALTAQELPTEEQPTRQPEP